MSKKYVKGRSIKGTTTFLVTDSEGNETVMKHWDFHDLTAKPGWVFIKGEYVFQEPKKKSSKKAKKSARIKTNQTLEEFNEELFGKQ